MSKKFQLSAVLYGHSQDVRCVTVTPDNNIVSGSRDRTAKLWRPNGINTGYTEAMTYRDQKNFVIAVLYIDPSLEYPDGLIITGGNDNTIYIYKPSEPFATFQLKEHSNAVSCFGKGLQPNTFLSGSWDSSAKFWQLGLSQSSAITFSGHSAAIWAVLQLQNGQYVTASADKLIHIWDSNGVRLNTLKGHTDCVRGLLELPQSNQIVSVANDATVRVWSYSGENIDTYYGHTNYIYSIAACNSGADACFVTSDEDHTVRFWRNGVNVDTFQLPAQSVWTVACLSNGDVVTGSSDGIVRIFTQDETRQADPATLNSFNEEVQALNKQSKQEIGGYKVSDLPGKEALYDPGKKNGQMKMIREDGGVVAYTWVESGDNSHWEKVGDVLGSATKDQQDKTLYEGKSYDFVFTVDVEDGKPPLKLPYNRGQDPYQAANEFLTRNILPASYLEQVVDFILKNTQTQFVPQNTEYVDPFTGGARYTPGNGSNQHISGGANLDPFTGANSYSTGGGTAQLNQGVKYFPVDSYRTFEMGDAKVILGKLVEFNEKWSSGGNNTPVDSKRLEELSKLCNEQPQDPYTFDILFKLLDWPDDLVFPVLDIVRLAVRNKKSNEIIANANSGILLDKLLSYINENCKAGNTTIVALRTLCNLFAHESGEDLVFERRFDIVENITALGNLNKNAQVALATLLLNLTLVCIKRNDDLGISVLADVLADILTKLTDPEAQFRCYVALGTLLTAASSQQILEVKVKVKDNSGFVSTLQLSLLGGQSDVEMKKRNCAKQIQDILNISF